MKRDYYDVLGVNKDASKDEINRAYRRLAKQYHPDVSSEKDAEEKFKEVQEAYDTLGDDEKRANYDRFGHESPFGNGGFGGQGFGGFEGFGGFSDIFSSFFGGGSQRVNPNAPRKGHDYERNITIDFLEAALGTNKTLKVEVEENCHTCGGTGGKTKSDVETCDRCKGQGFVTVEQRTILGSMRTQQVCSKCNGKGKTIKNKCMSCSGSGRQKTTKEVKVKIPAGIDNNMSLRMAGYGEGGINGGPAGDLYLRFKVRPHKVFNRSGDNILLEVPISFTQATLGDQIEVPTIYGDVKLKIPQGTQSGTILRMRDRGVMNVNTGRKGDQLVKVNIETPKNLTKAQIDALKAFDALESKETPWEKFKNMFKS